jgi:hypothetical protein
MPTSETITIDLMYWQPEQYELSEHTPGTLKGPYRTDDIVVTLRCGRKCMTLDVPVAFSAPWRNGPVQPYYSTTMKSDGKRILNYKDGTQDDDPYSELQKQNMTPITITDQHRLLAFQLVEQIMKKNNTVQAVMLTWGLTWQPEYIPVVILPLPIPPVKAA